MPAPPQLTPAAFADRLRQALPDLELPPSLLEALFAYYEELRRWAPRVDLIGPGTVDAAVERHFAESLAALPLLDLGARRLVDLGSGAGFPGLVLAAARPNLEVVLVEPRERRRAFLAAAARRARLSVTLLAVRVSARDLAHVPAGIPCVTLRALRLAAADWTALGSRLEPGAQVLCWSGAEPPALPAGYQPGRTLQLAGDRRWVREFRYRGGA